MTGLTRTALGTACAAALIAAAGASQATAQVALEAPTFDKSWSARVLAPVTARVHPRPGAKAVTVLQPVAPLGKGPTWLMVSGARRVDGRYWVRVMLPIRPNGSKGWIPADVLRFRETGLRIVVDQTDRRLTLFRAGRPVMKVKVAVGTPATPTPNGRFAIAEMIRTWTPGAFLGPVVFPLTGYSNHLNEYAGGNGRVAIHGTSLPELLGQRVSHGCIRVGNADIVKLARIVRPGTPVVVQT
ncbi:MAG: L,D-transpeptidase [Thermoleophilia bacterium]|nr:L,D-transpeptidase [Thermoleophilia bacterium]